VSGFDPTPDTRHPTPSSSGITLVELLVAMLIITILAALVLGVASVAGETARESQTQNTITRLHTLLMEHYDGYKTRRVRLRPQVITGINNAVQNSSARGQVQALARLHALRELIMMEVPDRWSDILLAGVPTNPSGLADARLPFFQDSRGASTHGRTALAGIYLRRYDQIANATNSLTGEPNDGEAITENQGAECLYLIITLACADGEARTMFHESDIGDTDGDGALEFLDGWGRPINFLRWAPGFDSQIQINANQFLPLPVSDEWRTAASKDHDPFDIFRVDPPAIRLVPLIYSAGGDETFGVRLVKPYVVYQGLNPNQLQDVPNPNNWPAIFPWAQVDDGNTRVFLGTADPDGTSTDNIHNHLLGLR
jgi:type II secretory pathway pseudopilin PulG